ncbi:MAG: prepilin-type N-terminal cleavage/methylation domain-containing protein [Bacilli bacterium]|nr:prepilin-type N-terminal cleavage/methylation domain-containing protein [Bacilli bacterium]
MNKKGLTIVELLAVLVVIGLMAVVIFPVITGNINDSQNKTNEIQKASIKEAAESYVADNVGLNIFLNKDTEEITLNTLIEDGYLTGNYSNPKTGKDYDLINSKVTIKKENNSYIYTIDLVTK